MVTYYSFSCMLAAYIFHLFFYIAYNICKKIFLDRIEKLKQRKYINILSTNIIIYNDFNIHALNI